MAKSSNNTDVGIGPREREREREREPQMPTCLHHSIAAREHGELVEIGGCNGFAYVIRLVKAEEEVRKRHVPINAQKLPLSLSLSLFNPFLPARSAPGTSTLLIARV
jgi:hypothetical protein